VVIVLQVAILVVFLTAWQFLPQVTALRGSVYFLDPYFISSPPKVALEVIALANGANGIAPIWPYAQRTLLATLVGTLIGMSLGAFIGLFLGSSIFWNRVLRPYIVGINAVPRIALIPIVAVVAGPTLAASIVIAILVVFFVAFFNAYEGARTVPVDQIRNAQLLGATRPQVMIRIRMPYALAWTLAAFPLGVTFGLLTVVTGELLTGYAGLGRLIELATVSGDSTLTFGTVVYVTIFGLAIVGGAEFIKRRVLHWWGAG
jgi:NitT/TauT family transport system permease protein